MRAAQGEDRQKEIHQDLRCPPSATAAVKRPPRVRRTIPVELSGKAFRAEGDWVRSETERVFLPAEWV